MRHKGKSEVCGNVKIKEKQTGQLNLVMEIVTSVLAKCDSNAGVHSWIWSKTSSEYHLLKIDQSHML